MKKQIVSILSIAIAISLAGIAQTQDNKSITIKGSDTMVQLVAVWAEKYMALHPEIQISVTGGGSGTGISAFINGTTDICSASRKMKDKEIEDAKMNNYMPLEHSVALDGIAIVVNPSNQINELTMEQLKKIFTGEYTNWKQLGGSDENIIVLSRESSSGTYMFFMEHVLNKQDYTKNARLLPATSGIIQSASEDIGAIGYAGLGYAADAKGKVKIIPVKKDDKSPAVMPSETTVKDGTYPVSRPLYLYTKANESYGGKIKSFIDFCLSEEGQKIVVDNGYVSVK